MHKPIKVILADLAHTYSVTDRSLTIPLGIGYVKAYAVEKLGADIDVSLSKHPERLLAAVCAERPQIVGFANYGWNENLNRAIGRYVRKALPDALVVAGGPNIDPAQDRRLAFLRKHDYLDFLIAKKSPQADASAKAMVAKGARLEGIPGMQEPIRLWSMSGMVTKVDAPSGSVFLINASAGRPEEPSPDSGEVIQMPPIQSQAGIAAMKTLQVGDSVITVWSQQTAIKATIIR